MSAPTATASVSVTEMGTVLTLKQLAELYLQDFISDEEYAEAETQAKRKLARIIEREGDADGERLKRNARSQSRRANLNPYLYCITKF